MRVKSVKIKMIIANVVVFYFTFFTGNKLLILAKFHQIQKDAYYDYNDIEEPNG